MLQQTWGCISPDIPTSENVISYGSSLLNFLRNLHTVFYRGINLHSDQPSLFSTALTILVSCLFDDSCSNRCEVMSYYHFDFHFPDD